MDFVSLLGSLIAIVMLALAAWKMFPATEPLSPERIRRNIARYSPEIEAKALDTMDILLSNDKKSAICLFADHPEWVAITKALGDRVVVRFYQDRNSLSIEDHGDAVIIGQSDFTFPRFTVMIAEETKKKLLKLKPVSET